MAVADLPVADGTTWATTSRTTRASTRCSARSRTSTAWSPSARERGLRVLLDVVPCHTSIEHPWFREHPDWYIWRDEPNNWLSAFGGSAWSPLDGRYYLHSFYPEQPDLDWRNPEVVAAMQDALRFWIERGAAGYRVDAIDRLLKDPRAARRPARHRGVRAAAERGRRRSSRSRTRATRRTRPRRSRSIREAVGDHVLVGEVYLPSARWQPYLESPRPRRSPSSCCTAPWDAERLRAAIEATHAPARRGVGALEPRLRPAGHALRARERRARRRCCCSRCPDRRSSTRATRSAWRDGPGGERRVRPRRARPLPAPDAVGRLAVGRLHDRRGRGCRRWIPERTNVEAQRDDPRSMLSLVRDLLAARRVLGEGIELLDAAAGRARLPARRAHASRSTRRPRSGPRRRPATSCSRRSRARSTAARSRPNSGAITMVIWRPLERG